MQSLTQVLANYANREAFDGLPDDVVNKTKLLIFDNIGCALGGLQTVIGERIVDLIRYLGGNPQSLVLGTQYVTSCALAAFANSEFANALDFDDTLGGHPGATVVPPSIATGEIMHASGKDLIAAVVAGYEVQLRIGAAVAWKNPIGQRLHPVTGSPWQVFGAVISAAKLLGLDQDETIMAVGIAGSTAPLPSDMKCSLNPTSKEEGTSMIKNNYGYMSETGIRAALMAKMGYTGPTDLLEGNTGFWRMIGSDHSDNSEMIEELGNDYRLLKIEFKPYSCCRFIHPIIEAALNAVRTNHINITDIEQIVLRTSKSQVTPPKDDYEPKTGTSIINSTPYSVAIALTGLKPGPDWFKESVLTDPDIRVLAKKMRLVADQPEGDVWRGEYSAVAEVTSKGKTYASVVKHPKGCKRNPMTKDELVGKFSGMAQPVLGTHKTMVLIDRLMHLETVDDITTITELLRSS